MRKKQFDLHLHSYFSDGKESPKAIIVQAKRFGLRLISITDHNTINHIPQELELARKLRVNYLPGVELSCRFQGRHIHLTAYGFDPTSAVIAGALARIQHDRKNGILQVAKNLRGMGFHIADRDLLKLKTEYFGLAHIIKILMKKPIDRARVIREVGSRDLFAIINHYFTAASEAYVPERYLPATQAIKMIRRAGGFVVLAHPGAHLRYQDDALIAQLKKVGLEGLEVFTPKHNWDQIVHYEILAKKLRLVTTAGSNFHEDFHMHDIPTITPIGFMKNPSRIFDAFIAFLTKRSTRLTF